MHRMLFMFSMIFQAVLNNLKLQQKYLVILLFLYSHYELKSSEVHSSLPFLSSIIKFTSKIIYFENICQALYLIKKNWFNVYGLINLFQACFQKSGASVVAIRKYIIHKYPSLELERRGYLLKQALKRELNRGVIKQVLHNYQQ